MLEYGPTGIPVGNFVYDQLVNGLSFRVMMVIDNWHRESVLLEVGFYLTGQSVIDAFIRIKSISKLRSYHQFLPLTMARNLPLW